MGNKSRANQRRKKQNKTPSKKPLPSSGKATTSAPGETTRQAAVKATASVETDDPPGLFARWWSRCRPYRRWIGGAITALGLVVGLAVGVPDLLDRYARTRQPEVEIRYFTHQKDGSLTLSDLSNASASIDPDDVRKSQVRLPLNLAFRNLEKSDLQNTRVVFSYPADLEVEPQGHPLISTDEHTLTYEHNLRDLAPIGEFTPLDTIDVLHIKFNFAVVPTVVLTKDIVPLYLLSIVGFDGKFTDKVVNIGVRVEVPGRPSASGSLQFTLKAGVQILGLDRGEQTRQTPVTADDRAWFAAVPAGARLLNDWDRTLTATNPPHRIHYQKLNYGRSTFQRISVDGIVRRLLIDSDGDQLVDTEVVDTTGRGIPDVREDGSHAYMPDWPADAVN